MSLWLAVSQSVTGSRVEEQRHHAADAGDGVRHAGFFRGGVQARRQASAQCFQPLVGRICRAAACSVAMPAAVARGLPLSVPA